MTRGKCVRGGILCAFLSDCVPSAWVCGVWEMGRGVMGQCVRKRVSTMCSVCGYHSVPSMAAARGECPSSAETLTSALPTCSASSLSPSPSSPPPHPFPPTPRPPIIHSHRSLVLVQRQRDRDDFPHTHRPMQHVAIHHDPHTQRVPSSDRRLQHPPTVDVGHEAGRA